MVRTLLDTVEFDEIPVFGKPILSDLVLENLEGATRRMTSYGDDMGDEGDESLRNYAFSPDGPSSDSFGSDAGLQSRRMRSSGDARTEQVAPTSDLGGIDSSQGLPGDDDVVMISLLSSTEHEREVLLETISAKPDEIVTLEQILSESYKDRIEITSINEFSATRKQVKEVHFLKGVGDWLNKVWIFKADPVETARELMIYHLAHKHGIPTGKPIGYNPTPDQTYPFDIAILGGVVEHAGDPYRDLLRNMRLRPIRIFDTAKQIARIIADYHVKLTLVEDEFTKAGVSLETSSPRKELGERFLAGLRITEENGEELLKACDDLYNLQSGVNVVSHGDIHLGNLVTVKRKHETSINQFGVIDWGSIVKDNPFGDLWDFWIHHRRDTIDATGNGYSYTFERFAAAYLTRINALRTEYRVNIDLPSGINPVDSPIQSSLWNLYEMYDPVRTDARDIQKKASFHCLELWRSLDKVEKFGGQYRETVHTIKKELTRLLDSKNYLKPYMVVGGLR